jgi:uncharacterized cupin superfamily protein
MANKPLITNIATVPETAIEEGPHWTSYYKPMTPGLPRSEGRLGMNITRLPAGQVGCPFHDHLIEDEIFYVLSGYGVLRYGDSLTAIGPGDCISCPAGKGIAHQIANPEGPEDLVYIAVGLNHPHEVCTYPDNGKVSVRGLKTVGYLKAAPYAEGEPFPPRILATTKGVGTGKG